MALSLCVCLATIFWCIVLARRQHGGLDKGLTGLLGMIATYEALRVLKDSGIVSFPGLHKLDGWVDFVIASLYLIAAMILKISSSERASTKVRLRLVEANEKTMDLSKGAANAGLELATALLEASPLAAFAVDANGAVIFWNTAAERLLGWSRDEALGQRLPVAGNGLPLNKMGHETGAAVWTAPIRGSNGSVRGTLTIAADGGALRDAGVDGERLPVKAELAVQH
jgi:PAS domain-containing protein